MENPFPLPTTNLHIFLRLASKLFVFKAPSLEQKMLAEPVGHSNQDPGSLAAQPEAQ